MNNNRVHKGVVLFYNVGRMYGFIKDDDSGVDYFCHNNSLIDHIKKNDEVTFEIIESTMSKHAGKVMAINVKLINTITTLKSKDDGTSKTE